MPTVAINRDLLYQRLGKQYTDEEFDALCFQFGIEVDDIVDDPEKGITLKIEIGANRYDLLCLEGIAKALNVFSGRDTIPAYTIAKPKYPEEYRLIVKPNTAKVRPYVVGAILRNIKFDQNIYNSFIDLQDKLHHNIARKRTLVAIGTHDLDTIQGPFIYDAQVPSDINFVPLNRTESFRSDKLLDSLAQDLQLREYIHIIKDKPYYPVIYDQRGVVLSLPPIINGDHSKITLNTKNVFIECTATDKFRAQVVLDTLVCMFSQYCNIPFSVEPVVVEYPSGDKIEYPKLEKRSLEMDTTKANILIGVNESPKQISELLQRMCLDAHVSKKDPNRVKVDVPPTRYDILHERDIVEDFGIAYGFDKLAQDMKLPPTNTIGQEFELNYLSDKIRLLLSQNSYLEAATFSLCSISDMGEKLRVDLAKENWVKVGNPKTTECEAVRNTLLPGILKTLASNKHISLPLKLFEVTDVVVSDDDPNTTKGVGARNIRSLCAVNYNVRPGVEIVQGLLDNIMVALKIPFREEGSEDGYCLEEGDHPSFFPGWCGKVMVNGNFVGRLGLIHPDVITNFALSNPAAALLLDLQKLFKISKAY